MMRSKSCYEKLRSNFLILSWIKSGFRMFNQIKVNKTNLLTLWLTRNTYLYTTSTMYCMASIKAVKWLLNTSGLTEQELICAARAELLISQSNPLPISLNGTTMVRQPTKPQLRTLKLSLNLWPISVTPSDKETTSSLCAKVMYGQMETFLNWYPTTQISGISHKKFLIKLRLRKPGTVLSKNILS